jgi:hypothetical protein
MLKKIRTFIAILVMLSMMITPGVKLRAAEETAAELVNYAIKYKTFYHFNLAYSKVINMAETQEKYEFLNQLAPIQKLVWTDEINKALNMLVDMTKTASARTYAEIEAFVESSSLGEWDKGYLLGELTSWGKKLVWTADYVKGINAVVKVYSENTINNLKDAVIAVNNIPNKLSREYLMDELSAVFPRCGLTVPEEYMSGKGLYVIFAYLMEDSFDSSVNGNQIQKSIDTAIAINESTKLINWFGRENRPHISLVNSNNVDLTNKILASESQLLPDTRITLEKAGYYKNMPSEVFEPSAYILIQDNKVSIQKIALPPEGHRDNIFIKVEYRTGAIESILFIDLIP